MKRFGKILGCGVLLLFASSCTNLTSRAFNLGTSFEHLTPTGKMVTTGNTAYLQLSSQEWERRYKTWLYGCGMDYFAPKANRPPRLLYAEISPTQKRLRWYQLREEIKASKKPLLSEKELRLNPSDRVRWEKFGLGSGVWKPKASAPAEFSDAGPCENNPIIRERNTLPGCLRFALGYLAFPLDMASAVVVVPLELTRG